MSFAWSPTDLVTEPCGSSRSLDSLTLSSCSSQFARGRGSLIGWDPWTNSQAPASQKAQQQQKQKQQQQKQQQSTLKAAGRIYDSMLKAERRAAARSSNNNTMEMQGGLSDVQRHTSGGQRTTVITRLASEMATCGGVLDVNFVIDTQSSNTEFSPDSRDSPGDSSPDASTGSDNWRWTHATPNETQPGGEGGAGGAQRRRSRPSKDQLLQDSESRDAAEAVSPSLDQQQQKQQTGGKSLSMQQQRQNKLGGEQRQADEGQLLGEGGAGGSDEGFGGFGGGGGGGGGSDDFEGDGEGEDEGGEGEGEGGDELDVPDEAPQQAEEKPNQVSARKKLSIAHLQKEGAVIGCMNVFADVMKREFMVLMTDSVIEAFLIEPSQFRAIARRTGCEIEVTRRILNRRIGPQRWVKYLVITIKGPNWTAINQCDRLMVKVFPPYKVRREYLEPAPVALFVKESYPDNTMLYFNFQRTGATADKLGDMRLQTPFGPCPYRPLENTPWKYADWRLFRGLLEPRNLAAEHTIQHVYPEWGTEVGNYVEPAHKWELAGDHALELEKRMALERSVRVKNRKLEAEPLFAENA